MDEVNFSFLKCYSFKTNVINRAWTTKVTWCALGNSIRGNLKAISGW